MATKAYFLINVSKEFCQHRYQDVLSDLKAVPEVESIQRISGTCNLLVKVDAPIKAIFVANKILVKEWVQHLQIFKVDPFRADEYQDLTVDELSSLRRITRV